MVLLATGRVITEFGIQNSGTKFFNVFTKQLHDLSNIAGDVHEGKVHQGDWHGIGSIKNWTITVGGQVETFKESIEAIDEENKLVTFSMYDGEIGKNYKIFKIHIQAIDKEDGGGVIKWTLDYEKRNEDIAPPYRYLDIFTTVTKDIDAHLLKA